MAWLEGDYVTMRPSFGDKDAIYAYRTEIFWDAAVPCLAFREKERQDAAYTQFGEVAVPNQSGHIYLVTNRHGQHRLITVSRPTIGGEMYGIITTLLAGRGSQLTPIAAPIAFLPVKAVPAPTLGRISPDDVNYALYRGHLSRTTDEPFACSCRARLLPRPAAGRGSGSRGHSPCTRTRGESPSPASHLTMRDRPLSASGER